MVFVAVGSFGAFCIAKANDRVRHNEAEVVREQLRQLDQKYKALQVAHNKLTNEHLKAIIEPKDTARTPEQLKKEDIATYKPLTDTEFGRIYKVLYEIQTAHSDVGGSYQNAIEAGVYDHKRRFTASQMLKIRRMYKAFGDSDEDDKTTCDYLHWDEIYKVEAQQFVSTTLDKKVLNGK